MKTAMVTGGGGFLGSGIVRMLLQHKFKVITLQRSYSAELHRLGVQINRGDISDRQTVIDATRHCDLIFHVAGKAGVWGDYQEYYQTNVVGTENIIAACRLHHINKLIYTSTPSVVFTGDDEEYIDESTPYADRFLTAYQETKALAEQIVLKANSPSLATLALRPHLIWGPGDPHLLPRIIQRAKAGRLRLVGKRRNLIDHTYIDNAALAHILAAQALEHGSRCAGKAYFISDGEPLPMAEWINKLLNVADLPAVTKTIPPPLAYMLATIIETVYKGFNLRHEPPLTRFIVRQLCCAHYYNLAAARRELGYCPLVSTDQGLARLKGSLQT